jgi:hypothetical protein
VNVSLLIVVVMLAAGQPETGPDEKARSAARLNYMQETAASIQIHVEETEGAELELQPQPVMRWDNHRSLIHDAATFIWLADHRPQVIGGMWIKNDVAWFDLQSLSAQPLTATIDGTKRWSTVRPGIEWQAVAGAPPPAASRAARLRQMKQLAQGFSLHAVKTAPDYDEGSIWHLRMMPQPVYRYAEEAAVDGAIFAFAQGTDPEAYVLLESRTENGTGRWHFSIGRGCGWELHAKRGDLEVWSVPKRKLDDPNEVYDILGPFAVDAKLVPAEVGQSRAAAQ